MALHRLLGMEVGVPKPAALDDFYQEIGLTGGAGAWGGAEHPDQIRVVEAPYRQLISMRVACEGEEDLATAAKGLDELGAKYQIGDGRLRFTDPINRWDVVVEPAEVADIQTRPIRERNRPGARTRTGVRAEAIIEATPRPPRRRHDTVTTPPRISTCPRPRHGPR